MRTGAALTITLMLAIAVVDPLRSAIDSAKDATTATTPATTQFVVMTYNVNVGMKPGQEALDAIAAGKPDVICGQEISPAWNTFLREKLKKQYPHSLCANHPSSEAFYSRYPLKEIKYIQPINGGWFPAWIVEVATPMGKVQVMNVHLRPNVDDRGDVVNGFLKTAKEVQKKEIIAYSANLKEKMPTVICGDFNEMDTDPAIAWLEDRSWTNALPQFDKHSPTWKGKIFGVDASYRPDHILYSAEMKCVKAFVVNKGVSDHLPVVAVFEMKQPATRPTTSRTRP